MFYKRTSKKCNRAFVLPQSSSNCYFIGTKPPFWSTLSLRLTIITRGKEYWIQPSLHCIWLLPVSPPNACGGGSIILSTIPFLSFLRRAVTYKICELKSVCNCLCTNRWIYLSSYLIWRKYVNFTAYIVFYLCCIYYILKRKSF